MQNSVLTILVEGPEKNILQLHNQLRIQEEVNNLTQYTPYFDHIKKNQIHTYGILLESNKSDVPFFIKVTTFTGAIESHKLYKVSPERRNEVALSTPVNKYGEFEIRLSPEQIRK
jgi:pantothenate kinase